MFEGLVAGVLRWLSGLEREVVENAPGTQWPAPLQDFAGERPVASEHSMPGHISPDALNIDYRDGTLKKRAGVARLGVDGAVKGGVWVNYSVSGSNEGRVCRSESVVTLSETLQTYNFIVSPTWLAVGNDVRVFLHETAGGVGTGLWLKNDSGTYRWEARCEHSGGTLAVMQTGVEAATAAIRISFEGVAKYLTMFVGDDVYTDTIGANTYTQPAGKIYLGGATGSDYDKNFEISDVRVWDGTVGGHLDASTPRPLTTTQQTAALIIWWRMLVEDSATGYLEDDGASDNKLVLVGAQQKVSRGFVPALDSYWDVEAVVAVTDYAGATTFYFACRGGVYSQLSLAALSYQGSMGLGKNHNYGVDPRSFRAQALLYRGYPIVLDGVGENLIVDTVAQLSYGAPDMDAPLTVATAGSGGSVDAGVHNYFFAVYNSATGVVSAVGTEISTQTSVGSDILTIDFTTGGANFMPNRYYRGGDKIRIYRTKAGGSTYYHLTDVAIDSTSHADSAADITLVTLRPTYVGYANPSRFGFELNNALWLGNQQNNESRLVYTEPNSLGAFYSDNYVDIGAGDNDVLVGGIGIGGTGVVFKRRSVWAVQGAGGSVSVQQVFPGVGCVQHATIAASHNRVFWLAEGGVYAMPLPLGAPVSITGSWWRSYFSVMTEADYEGCSGVWDGESERYILSLLVAGTRYTMVYCALRDAWALWDLEVSGFWVGNTSNGNPAIYCGWRNWLAELESGVSDGGGGVDESGTVTGATTSTITDSTAAWADNFENLTITVVDQNDGSLSTAVIRSNTSTVITIDGTWSVASGDGYVIGGIGARWRSPRMSLDRWDRQKRVDRVRFLSRGPYQDAPQSIKVTTWGEGDPVPETFTVDPSKEIQEVAIAAGFTRTFRVQLENEDLAQAFDVSGISVGLQQLDGGM